MHIFRVFLPLFTCSFVVSNDGIESLSKSAKNAEPDGGMELKLSKLVKMNAKLLAKVDAQEKKIESLAEVVQLQNKEKKETPSKRDEETPSKRDNWIDVIKNAVNTEIQRGYSQVYYWQEEVRTGLERTKQEINNQVSNMQWQLTSTKEDLKTEWDATKQNLETKLDDVKEGMTKLREEVSYSGSDEEVTNLVRDYGGSDINKREEAREATERITAMDMNMHGLKTNINTTAADLTAKIENNPKLSQKKKEKLKAEVEQRRSEMERGAEKSRKTYRKMEVNVIRGGSGYKPRKRVRALRGLKSFGSGLMAKGSEVTDAVVGSIAHLMVLIDPEQPWQKRTEAGLAMVALFAAFLPQPFGLIGSAILGIAGAAFGAAAPTTNEYKVLRNQLLNGISEMFDNQQKADAMGCVYKLEFLTEIMKVQSNEDKFSPEEFNALIISGGIDVGVSTLGNLKWKSEDFRDKNEIKTGRQALEMAHMYVLVAEARDALTDQIIAYLNITADCKEEGLHGGFSIDFFVRARDIGRKNYKDLFWWDELCCEKEKYFSALLAYGMPIKKHAGKDKAAGKLHKFLKTHLTKDYDKKSEAVSLEECPPEETEATQTVAPTASTTTSTPLSLLAVQVDDGIPKVERKKFPPKDRYIVLGSMMKYKKDHFMGVSTTDVTINRRRLKNYEDPIDGDQWLKKIEFMEGEYTDRTELKFEYLDNPALGDPFAVKVNADLPGCFVKVWADADFQGTSHVYRGVVHQLTNDNDLTSFKLPYGCCVRLYKDANLEGESWKYCGSVTNIGTFMSGMFFGENWDDQVSSLEVTGNGPKSFVTTMEAVIDNRDKIFDNNADQSLNGHYKMEDTLNMKYKETYDKWSLVAMRSKGQKWTPSGKEPYNYEEKMTKDKAYVRLFPVKLPTWGEVRYLLGPAGKYIDDDLILLGVDMRTAKGGYQKIDARYLQDDSGTSDANGRPEMKEVVLNHVDTWKKLFLVVRGNFSDSGDRRGRDRDIYPAGLNGGNIDMQCEWTDYVPTGGNYEHEDINYNKGGYRGCASSVIHWKTRISTSASSDKSAGYTALTMKVPDLAGTDSEATGDCRGYHNMTSLTPPPSTGRQRQVDRKTCVFKTTKGCYYTIKVTDSTTSGHQNVQYFHIDGMENKRNRWVESTTDEVALWFDKKNWCVGPKTRKGKKCEGAEGWFTGKIPESESTPGVEGSDAEEKSTEDEAPQCPTDPKLRWYRTVTTGSDTQEEEANFEVREINIPLRW